ncbi:hypothetical protein THAOC_15589 [Thalassiosira oceanica]|uniref:Uncharacterized protein n=1 Tax=Thalassiosira oceanica TaxID=159749 RepID=K0SZZ1_THAOC|nr:hypothetical protein THAOC_15589 [Thalassiosira oceanica]|eukprot:EJK63737.1 hypothetical protein THAOC_15589 [Thalassiosira oceanica]
MQLRCGKHLYPKCDPAFHLMLRSGRGLCKNRDFDPTAKKDPIKTSKLDDGYVTPMKLVPDEAQSSSRLEEEDLADFTPPAILRKAMRKPVDAMVWVQLSCEEKLKLAQQGRAPIKKEGGGWL